jgi:hypothetical protein
MKLIKQVLLAVTLLASSMALEAQVTIGSNNKPDFNALLDLKGNVDGSSSKGLLLPRVALSSTTLASPLTAFVKGMTVYNTAIAGDVTPGYYYSDGSKWIRLVNATTDQTVEVSGLASGLTSPNDFSGGTFSPATPASSDYIYINIADGTTWTYSSSSSKYLRYVAPATTEWYLASGTTDAGADKTGRVYRTGNVGIGTNNPTAKLEVNNGTTAGAIKIVDGTQGASRILVSDANGVGTWQASSPTVIVSSAGPATAMTSGVWVYTGASATVTKAGCYLTSVRLLTDKTPSACGQYFLFNLSTSSTSNINNPFYTAHMPPGTQMFDLIYTTVTGNYNVGTYYLWAMYYGPGCTSNVIRSTIGQNSFTLTYVK